MKKTLAIESLVIDKRYQSRVGKLDKDHVADLVSAYAGPDGDSIDAPRVFEITGKGYILTRGFHRVEALSQSGRKRIECEVKGGTIADALTDAAASNIGHGLKRTNADKRRSVEMILEAHPDWSDRQVAESAGVTHPFVSEMRQVVTVTTSNSKTTEETQKRTGRDGKQHPASRNGKPKPKNDVSPDKESGEKDDEEEDKKENDEPETEVEKLRRESLEAVEKIAEFCYKLDTIAKELEDFREVPGAYSAHWQTARDQIRAVRSQLWIGRPVECCPYCKGTGQKSDADCKGCRGHGWCTKSSAASGKSAMGAG